MKQSKEKDTATYQIAQPHPTKGASVVHQAPRAVKG